MTSRFRAVLAAVFAVFAVAFAAVGPPSATAHPDCLSCHF